MFETILSYTEAALPWIRRDQILDKTHPHYGGYIPRDRGYADPNGWGSGAVVSALASLYLCPESRFFRNRELLDRAEAAAVHILNHQNSDGTLDQIDSNFGGGTSAAFAVEILADTYELLRTDDAREVQSCRDTVETLLLRLGQGLLSGGFHTPNHRWVMAAACARLHRLFDSSPHRELALKYLAEGIDQNRDGTYTERSVGGYDAVVDRALLSLSRDLYKPDLMEYVKKNLALIKELREPDGSLYTGQSQRQDRGKTIYPARYLRIALKTALLTGDEGVFDFARSLTPHLSCLFTPLPGENLLTLFLRFPALKELSLPTDGRERAESPGLSRHYPDLGLHRFAGENYAVTLARKNPRFLTFSVGSLTLSLRLCASFFARGQFSAPEIVREGDALIMEHRVRYGYLKPFAQAPETNRWEEMDQGDWRDIGRFNTPGLYPRWEEIDFGARETCHVRELLLRLTIREREGGVVLDFEPKGPEGVIYAFEFLFSPGGEYRHGGVSLPGEEGRHVIDRAGGFSYTAGLDGLLIEEETESPVPSGSCHNRTDLRGGLEKSRDEFTVYRTGTLPGSRRFAITRPMEEVLFDLAAPYDTGKIKRG